MKKMSWDKNYKVFLFSIAVLLTLFILFFESLTKRDLTAYEKLNLLFIAYTGLVVTWYTKETYDLKQQGRKALLSSIQPIIVAYKIPSGLILKNVGRGLAKNLLWKELKGDISIISDPNQFPGILEPSQGIIEKKRIKFGGDLIAQNIAYKGENGAIRIFYEDDRNNIYYSDIKIDIEKARLLKTGSIRELPKKEKEFYKKEKKELEV